MKTYSPFEENGIDRIYEEVYRSIAGVYGSATDRLVSGLENQKESMNDAYERSARTAYNNYLINNENLNTQLINAGLSENGMTESSQIASTASYGAELRENENSRKDILGRIDSQIANVRYNMEKSALEAKDALNESRTNYLINKETAQQKEAYKREKNRIKHEYEMDALERKYAREDEEDAKNYANKLAMSFLNEGVVPEDELLAQADIGKEYAQTYADAVNEEKEKEREKAKQSARKAYYATPSTYEHTISAPYDVNELIKAYNALSDDIISALDSAEYDKNFGTKYHKRIEILSPMLWELYNWIIENSESVPDYNNMFMTVRKMLENVEYMKSNLYNRRNLIRKYESEDEYKVAFLSGKPSEELRTLKNESEQQKQAITEDERYKRIMAALKKGDTTYAEFEADAMWIEEVLGVDVTKLSGKKTNSDRNGDRKERSHYKRELEPFTEAKTQINNAIKSMYTEDIERYEKALETAQELERQDALKEKYKNIQVAEETFAAASENWGDNSVRGAAKYLKNCHATDDVIESALNGYVGQSSADYESFLTLIDNEISQVKKYEKIFDKINDIYVGQSRGSMAITQDEAEFLFSVGIDIRGMAAVQIFITLGDYLNTYEDDISARLKWLESQRTELDSLEYEAAETENTLSYHSLENFNTLSVYNEQYAQNVYEKDFMYLIVNRRTLDGKNRFRGDNDEYLNMLDREFLDEYSALQVSRYKNNVYLTEDEIATFNYIYATEGRSKASKYLDRLKPMINKRITQIKSEEAAEFAEDHPVLASVKTVLDSVPASVLSVVSNINDMCIAAAGGEIDPYSLLKLPQKEINIARQVVSSNLGEVGAFLYNAGMSMADSGMRMVFTLGAGSALGLTGTALAKFTSVTSSVLSGSTVMQNSIEEALSKGYSDIGAVAYGLAIGTVECLSEKAGIDKILEADGSFLARTLNNIVSEGSEEVASNWGGRVIGIIADGKNNEFALKLKEYRDAGASNKEALLKTVGDIAAEDAATFIAGGLSGFVMGEIHHGSDVLSEYVRKTQTIKSNIKNLVFDAKIESDIHIQLKNAGETDANAEKIVSAIKNIRTGNATRDDIILVAQSKNAQTAMDTYLDTQLEGKDNVVDNIVDYAQEKVDTAAAVKILQMSKEGTDVRRIYGEKAAQFENNSPFEDNLGASAYMSGDEFVNTIKDDKFLLKYVADHMSEKDAKYLKNFRTLVEDYGDKFKAEEEAVKNYVGQIAFDSDKIKDFIELGLKNREILVAYRDSLEHNIDRFDQNFRPQLEAALELTERVLEKMDKNLSENVEISRNDIVAMYDKRRYNTTKPELELELYNDDISALSEKDAYDENGNLKPDIVYRAGECDYRFKTDSLGRIVCVEVKKLEWKKHEGRLKHEKDTPEKKAYDHAMHLIADMYGGSGELSNVLSGNARVNLVDYANVENTWRDYVGPTGENKQPKIPNHTVSVRIQLSYEGDSFRPGAFRIMYQIKGINSDSNAIFREITIPNYRYKE